MRRENRNNVHSNTKVQRARYWTIIGFLASVTLLSIVFFMSVNEDKIDDVATQETNENKVANITLTAASEISKTINEIANSNTNTIKKQNNEIGNAIVVETVTQESSEEKAPVQEPEVRNQVDTENDKVIESKEPEAPKENSEPNNSSDEVPASQFIKPVDGEIYKEFSMDSLVYSDTLHEWVTHRGIDIKADMSVDVKASAGGTIKSIKNDPRFGSSIIIEHSDGFCTIYTCLVSTDGVKEGDNVKQGDVIGKVGNSGVFEVADGSHLHLEMTKDGQYINPEMYIK